MINSINSNYEAICKLFNFGKKEFLSLEKLKKEVKICDIRSSAYYKKYRKEYNKINWPSHPCVYYNIKWSELLGKSFIVTEFLFLEEFKKELKICDIRSQTHYKKYRKEHNKIHWPSAPYYYYNIKWNELIGKATEFLSLEKLKKEVKICDIRSQTHYGKYRKEHNKIHWPSAPDKHYNIKWSELLGKKATEFLSIEELKKEVKICDIRSGPRYRKYRKEHNKINWPSAPDKHYNIKLSELLGKS
jgi:preprotein translocase subunit SecE